ncbi:cyclic nucleotide-binding domain-containing protein [Pararhizobium sp. IMCC21322]|uniref:cyclic nucleotide-binding domain-containing protein n=1 Tax=Pararhizobium sp. IMCC21322 TaxID=3067903 RepID=UPI0027417D7B|nr:cyclic nucleotide-binding domain-containing protein [Pararhizobium sp. IMCC21322]
MRPDDLLRIRELPLFRSMGQESFEGLTNAAYLQHFPPQVELIHEGDPADFLYIVVEGAVELFAKSNGREASMAIVKPVGTFILAAVLKDAVYLMSARTTKKSRVLMIPSENIRTIFKQDDTFARAIVLELASCYRAIVKDHKSLKLRSGVERLANRLIRYRSDQNSTGSIELPYDKRTLASLMGMTPENLSRAFKTLKPYGVKVEGSRIHMEDMESLEKLAKVNPLIDDRHT